MKDLLAREIEKLSRRERVLLACLSVQVVVYWILAFTMTTGSELVAYQRY